MILSSYQVVYNLGIFQRQSSSKSNGLRIITSMLIKQQQQDITHVLTSHVDSTFIKLGYFWRFL